MNKLSQFLALSLLAVSAHAGIAVAPGPAQATSGSVVISPDLTAALNGTSTAPVPVRGGTAVGNGNGTVVINSGDIVSSLSQTNAVSALTAAARGGVTGAGTAVTTYLDVLVDGQRVNITVNQAEGTVTITKI